MTRIDSKASWERIASLRVERPAEGISYGKHEPHENHLQLLGDVQGKRILDLGCGAGANCLAFAEAGAEAVGVDFSSNQIDKARSLCREEDSVKLHVADMLEFAQAEPDSSYDIVFSSFALLYVEDLQSLAKQVRRILRPGGAFLFSMKHRLAEITEVTEGTVCIRSSYFDTGSYEWSWSNGTEKVPLVSHSWTPGQIVSLLHDAGFIIERFIEPEPLAEHASPSEEEMTLAAMVPTAMIWKARVG